MAFCTACGHPRRGATRFCTRCGAEFGGGAPAVADTAADTAAGTAPARIPGQDTVDSPGFWPQARTPGVMPEPPGVMPEPPGVTPEPPGGEPAARAAATAGDGTSMRPRAARRLARPNPRRIALPNLSRRVKTITIVGAAVAVLAAGGIVTAVALLGRHPHPARAAAGRPGGTPSAAGQPNATSSQQVPSASPVSPTSSPGTTQPTSGDIVATAPGVAANPNTPQVTSFLTSYFTAINDHAYEAYLALLGPNMQQSYSSRQFSADYGSTADSGAILTGISTLSNGEVAATVKFTSHQLPAQSPDHTACTRWVITLYLASQGGGYVIGTAPPGYSPSHRPC